MTEPAGAAGEPIDLDVLVVSNHTNTEKIHRHWSPLGDVAGAVTMVCVNADPAVESVSYRRVPAPGHRLVGVVGMFFVALAECVRGDYDAVAAMSLFPYGAYALVLGALFGLPTHLGVIGSDLDRHATSWYGPVFRVLFRQFTTISVPGTAHRERLLALGVPGDRVSVLANAIDTEVFDPAERSRDPAFTFLWIGRFSPEKDPLLFVRGLATLRERGHTFTAVMAGDGELAAAVAAERDASGLEPCLSLPGWVDEPLGYYARSSVYVLTSEREGLPLTLLEAMAVGLPAVVPDVGSVTDAVAHRETGWVVDPMTPERLADALEALLVEPEVREHMAERAPRVRAAYSFDAARADWRAILGRLAED